MEYAFSFCPRPRLRRFRSPQILAHCTASRSQLPCHSMGWTGSCAKRVDFDVAFLTRLLALPLSDIVAIFSRRLRLFRLHNSKCFLAVLFLGNRRQGQGRHDPLGNVAQVLEQVLPIRHLNSVRCSSLCSVRKGPRKVSAYGGNRRMPRNQVARTLARASERISTGRPVSRSHTIAPYRWPLRHAHSSTPTTRKLPHGLISMRYS